MAKKQDKDYKVEARLIEIYIDYQEFSKKQQKPIREDISKMLSKNVIKDTEVFLWYRV